MYYISDNNKIYLADNDLDKINNTLLFMPNLQDLPIQETDREIIIVDNEFRFKDEVEERLAEIEAERVAMLKMTPRDFLLALVEMGVDFEQVEQLINSNPQVKIELNYCNHIYRGNPLLDQLAPQFNITKEQLDTLFKEKGE